MTATLILLLTSLGPGLPGAKLAIERGRSASSRSAVGAVGEPGRDWPPGFRVERFDWQRDLAPGGSVFIDNPWGDVHARLNGAPRLDVYAVVQSEGRDPERAEVELRSERDAVRVGVRYRGERVGGESDPPVRRVDLTVFVPSGSSLSIETGAGAVDVRGLESDVDARATTGDLAVSTSGSIRAGTHSGSIQAELHGSSWTQVPDFETRTGRISVRFAPGAGALLCASTGGEISVEAPLELEAGADGSLVVVGAGGPRIRLRSEHGDIRIAAPAAGSSRAGDREERP